MHRKFLFGSGRNDISPENTEKSISKGTTTTKGSTKVNGIFQETFKKDAKSLYEILTKEPKSEQSEIICNDKELFQTIKPTYWITVAKKHSSLFEKILAKPTLAKWVNQFPASNYQGLIMIATYSNEHLLLAHKALLTQKESDTKIFSEEQCQHIENTCAVTHIIHR